MDLSKKTPLPEDPIFSEPVTFRLRLDSDPDRFSSARARFRFADCCCDVINDETGELLGSIGGAMFGVLEVHVGKRTWSVDPRVIWAAAVEADRKYAETAPKI